MPTLLDPSLSIFGMKLNNNSSNFSLLTLHNNAMTPTAVRSLNNLAQHLSSSSTSAIIQNSSGVVSVDSNNFFGGSIFCLKF